jgi:hypothetical protein
MPDIRATSRLPPTAYRWWPRRVRRSITIASTAQPSMITVESGTGPIWVAPTSRNERGAEPVLPW